MVAVCVEWIVYSTWHCLYLYLCDAVRSGQTHNVVEKRVLYVALPFGPPSIGNTFGLYADGSLSSFPGSPVAVLTNRLDIITMRDG